MSGGIFLLIAGTSVVSCCIFFAGMLIGHTAKSMQVEEAAPDLVEAVDHVVRDGHIRRHGTHHAELLAALSKLGITP